jgi:hypothetical protein
MTPYSIITVFQIGLLLLVMRLYSQSFIIIITNDAGARFTVSRKPYFPSDCGFFLNTRSGSPRMVVSSLSRLVYIIMILYRLSRKWRSPLSNIGL